MPGRVFRTRRRPRARAASGERRARLAAFLGLKDLREGLTATLLTSTGSLAVGLLFAASRGRIEIFPVLMVLIPAMISTRGHIFGALGSRLGSQLHLGLIAPRWRRSRVQDQNFAAAIALSLVMGLVVGVEAYAAARILGGGATLSAVDLALVSALTGFVSGLLLFGASLLTAFVTFKRGLNPDNFTAPILTLAGDAVTLPLLLGVLEVVILLPPGVRLSAGAVAVAAGVLSVVYVVLAEGMRPHARRVMAESFPTFLVASLFSLLAGVVLLVRVDALLETSGIITLVPSFLLTGGAIGAILASHFASALHVGRLEARVLPPREAHSRFLMSHVQGLAAFALLGVLAWLLNIGAGIPTPPLATLVVLSSLAGQLLLFAANLLAYYASITAFRMGLDPDNVVIPVLTSTMDLVGTLSLVGMAGLLGVL